MKELKSQNDHVRLVADVRSFIESARAGVGQAVNSALVVFYWSIGDQIRRNVLGGKRSGDGEQIVQTLSAQLTADDGVGFNRPNLFRIVQFAEYSGVARLSQHYRDNWVGRVPNHEN